MKDKLKGIVIAGVAVAALAAGGAAIAGAANGGDGGDKGGDQKQITGDALAKASNVALARTGADRVTDTEIRDEEGYYEVEVERKDGSRFDVHLDRHFNVIDASPDGAGDTGR
jgi:uncharacterized membrane protein YkoI